VTVDGRLFHALAAVTRNARLDTYIMYIHTYIMKMYIHCESKKLDPFSLEHNFHKYCLILIIKIGTVFAKVVLR